MTKGNCTTCERTMAKAAMTQHIAACDRADEGLDSLLLSVSDRGAPSDFWPHLEVPAAATLHALDAYLRGLWLECCGHLSMFEIGGRSFRMEADLLGIGRRPAATSTNRPIADLLQPGDEARHLYDMGSTTELQVRCLERRPGRTGGEIRLLARNVLPEIACSGCGATATRLCTECSWEGVGELCDACAGEHACNEALFLPVANSPRFGVCGYTG